MHRSVHEKANSFSGVKLDRVLLFAHAKQQKYLSIGISIMIMRNLFRTLLLAGLFPLLACEAQIGTEIDSDIDTIVNENAFDNDDGVPYAAGATVNDAAFSGCSTAGVRGLSDQLIAEVEVIQPGTLQNISNIPGVNLGANAFPYLQTPAANALRNAMANGGSIQINSALRSLAQQFVLYTWYINGRCTSSVTLAASPGTSNHERGLAIDTSDYVALRSKLESKGFQWHGGNDVVHFDYVAGGQDLSGLSIKAFQRLWNRNNPNDKISEDGSYGPQTESRLRLAPAAGFPVGPGNIPAVGMRAIAFDWFRNAGGDYDFTASAPNDVVRVEYLIEGFNIGTATRTANGDDFYISYTFNNATTKRKVLINGFNASNVIVAQGVGMIDSIPGTAAFIWHRADRTYTVGIERPPTGVVAIEVRIDGILLTDSTSGLSHSTRLAVRQSYTTLGNRHFQIKMFNSSNTVVGTFDRDITLQ
jgi:hypothetical protein